MSLVVEAAAAAGTQLIQIRLFVLVPPLAVPLYLSMSACTHVYRPHFSLCVVVVHVLLHRPYVLGRYRRMDGRPAEKILVANWVVNSIIA